MPIRRATRTLESMADYTLHLARGRLHATGMRQAQQLVGRATRKTLSRSAILCPVDTGLLRASGGMTPVVARGATVEAEVRYTAEYAAAVHNGRRALTIRPRRANGRLRFKMGGRIVYARRVHQKARKAHPFLTTALREVAAQEGFRFTNLMR